MNNCLNHNVYLWRQRQIQLMKRLKFTWHCHSWAPNKSSLQSVKMGNSHHMYNCRIVQYCKFNLIKITSQFLREHWGVPCWIPQCSLKNWWFELLTTWMQMVYHSLDDWNSSYSQQRHRFSAMAVYVEYMVEKVAPWWVSVQVLPFLTTSHHSSNDPYSPITTSEVYCGRD